MTASPLLGRRGAVAAGGADAGVAAHYGEPIPEQRALARGRAVVDLSHLGVVAISGPERLSWLHTLSSQHLSDLAPGASTELLLLDPQGHIEHAARLVDDGERTWLITDSGRAEALAAFLEKMKFWTKAEVERPDAAVLGTRADGPAIPGAVARWVDPWPAVAPGGTRYGPDAAEHPGAEWAAALTLVPAADLADAVARAEADGARLAGVWAWEALRVASWRPRHNAEVDERALPHELDWLRTAVHLDKGCYRGQESIARVFNLGKPPRRLVLLHLDGSEHVLPETGAPVLSGERAVGTLTSVVRHHELGPIGLALVKRSTPADAPLTAGGIAAAQELIVGVDGTGTGRPEPIDRQGLRRRDLGGI